MTGSISSFSPFGVASIFNTGFLARGSAPVLAALPTGVHVLSGYASATRASPRVSPLWSPDAERVQAAAVARSGGFAASGLKSARHVGEQETGAAAKANIVSGPLLELRAKAKPFPADKAAYAAHKRLLIRLDPDRDVYVNVHNQPDNEPAVVVNISMTVKDALDLGLFKISGGKDGKQSLVLIKEANRKVYIELGEQDISFSEMTNIGDVFLFPIQIPLAALQRGDNGRYRFAIRVADKSYPFEAGRYSHDRVGF